MTVLTAGICNVFKPGLELRNISIFIGFAETCSLQFRRWSVISNFRITLTATSALCETSIHSETVSTSACSRVSKM